LFVKGVSPVGFYLDENCEETMVDSFSEQSYYISHDVGVRVSMHRGGFPFPRPFLRGGEKAS
jgi:hypothetical protein